MCNHHSDSSQKRHGASLEHGKAHHEDHKTWSRRSFLSTLGIGAMGSGLMLGGIPVNAMARTRFLNRLANANTNKVLVLIQLGGGNDGLNTIIPVENDIYYQKRPTIAIPKANSILLNDSTGMHPSLESLRPLWDAGNMAVINNVGYENPNRSHARATDIWTSASDENVNLSSGWAGRFLVEDNPEFIGNPPEYPLGIRIGGSPTLFQSEFGNLGVTFGGASQFAQFLEQGGFYNENGVPQNEFGRSLSFARKIANSSFKYLEAIQSAADQAGNLVEYPNSGLASSLAVVARLIRGRLPTKVYLVSKGGFDTHNNQGGTEGGHANLLADIANSVQAFYNDLSADNHARNALTMTFSEFGRTLDENSSKGTDHGSSAPVMVFGSVNGGVYGEPATLTELDRSGDPIYSTDYRSIYRSILSNWFDMEINDAQSVLNGDFDDLGFMDPVVLGNEPGNQPKSFSLKQNYPNPFNPSTNISFHLQTADAVSLEMYSLDGKHIRTLIQKKLGAGTHSFTFYAGGLSSGTYLYRLTTSKGSLTRKMTLIK